MSDVKPGFISHDRKSPVTSAWEPIYSNRDSGVCRIAIVLDRQHCNGREMLHGGVIAALADNAMGLSLGMAALAAGEEQTERAAAKGIVTTSLSVDYLGIAKLGQWVEVVPRVVKLGKSSGTVDALIEADGEVIARANASFRVLR